MHKDRVEAQRGFSSSSCSIFTRFFTLLGDGFNRFVGVIGVFTVSDLTGTVFSDLTVFPFDSAISFFVGVIGVSTVSDLTGTVISDLAVFPFDSAIGF